MSVWCLVLSRECTAGLSELFKKHCPVAVGTEADGSCDSKPEQLSCWLLNQNKDGALVYKMQGESLWFHHPASTATAEE